MPARFAVRGHGHARLHLVIVAEGDFEQEISDGVLAMKSGAVRLSCAHAQHRLAFGDAGATCAIMEAEGPFWTRVFTRALGPRENVFGAVTPAQALALAQVGGVEQLVASRDAVLGFGRMLARLSSDEVHAPAWLDDAVDLLDRGTIRSVSAIARRLERDRVHFARSFVAHTGFRPSEYRALRRAGDAVTALRAADASLCDIALEHGFTHQSHMTNTFRALLGVAPGRLRGL